MATTDAKPVPVKNAALHVGFPILDADGDLVAGASALDSEVSTDSGGFADCTNEAAEETTSSGMYELLLTAGEMNGDIVMVIVKSTEGKTTPMVFYPQEAGDINVNVETISADATAADNLELFFDGTGYNAANSTVGTATNLTTNNDKTGYTLSAGGVDAIWDEALSGHTTLATFGQVLNGLGARTGAVNDAGALSTDFDIDGLTETTNDHFNGQVMTFTTGALTGQSRVITDYVGAAQNCVFAEAWTEAPANNDEFVITNGGTYLGGTLSDVARLFVTILNASTGQLDSGSLTAGTIDAAAIATGAIDADALAADAVDEIWDEAMVEASSVPGVTGSFRAALQWMFALSRNKITQTATTQTLRNDADAGNIATAAVSDDGTTATRNEWA